MTQFKPDIKLSKFQEDIINKVLEAIQSNKPINIAVNAVAGSGKSTTIKYIAIAAHQAGIKIDDIRITVFGKKNAKDLQTKLGRQWEKSIGTLHSTGFALIQKELGSWSRSDKIDDYKYEKIARELGYINGRGKDRTISTLIQDGAIAKDNGELSFLKILSLLRLTLREPTFDNVNWLINHFQIEGIKKTHMVASAADDILQIGQEWALEKKIDFADQIWLPVLWQLHEKSWFKKFKLFLTDEGQDLNAAQLQLSINLRDPNGIGVYVGDDFQSIMGFSGADCHSWQNIIKLNNAIEMPLSICYRCGKKHIELVNKLFPNIPITAYENNHDGEIIQIKEDELEKYLYKGAKSIMVISRKTAPLVSQCIKLISRGVPAQVKGRDIGKTLISEVEAIALTPGFNWQNFAHWIEQYRIGKLTQYRDRDNYEQLKEALDDRLEAIMAIYDAIGVNKTLDAFKIYTEDLFSDTDEEAVIYLSTVHSAKGLEREDIVIIKPDDLPMRWRDILPWQEQQEDNLHYVALTRAKNKLIVIGDCKWYKPEDKDEPKTITVEKSPGSLTQDELEQEIRDYFKNNGLKEPKLTEAYLGVVNITVGAMGKYDIDERVKRFFSPKHRNAVKQFAYKLYDLREEEIETESAEMQRIEAHLEAQRQKLGMRDEHYEYDGEVRITPDDILVESYDGKIYNYPRNSGIPEWASLFPILYYPGCEPNLESVQLQQHHEPTDDDLKEAVQKAITRFGPKNVIVQAIQQATVSEIQEIMAILDDW